MLGDHRRQHARAGKLRLPSGGKRLGIHQRAGAECRPRPLDVRRTIHVGASRAPAGLVVGSPINLAPAGVGSDQERLASSHLSSDDVKGAHARDRYSERVRHRARRDEPDPQTSKRPGPYPNSDGRQFGRPHSGVGEHSLNAGCKQFTVAARIDDGVLATDTSAVVEGNGDCGCGSVEGEKHVSEPKPLPHRDRERQGRPTRRHASDRHGR